MPMQATTTTPLFSAALRPDRSLRLTGGWIALSLCAIAALPLIIAAPSLALPVSLGLASVGAGMGFIAFRQLRAKRITQQVTLWVDQLEIATTQPSGEKSLQRFDPHTVRLVLDRDENEKMLALRLRNGKESIEVGAFLSPEDKASFAKALGTALRKARAAG
jgi:uncharacterized membrane protein